MKNYWASSLKPCPECVTRCTLHICAPRIKLSPENADGAGRGGPMEPLFQSNPTALECRNLKRLRPSIVDASLGVKRQAVCRSDDFDDGIDMGMFNPPQMGLLWGDSPASHVHEAFGHQWYLSERELEPLRPAVMPALGEPGSEIERRRLETIRSFWGAAGNSKLSIESLELTFSLWGRLLQHHKGENVRQLSCKAFAASAAAALRMAIKFNERLEVIWELPKTPWELLAVFEGWPVDKTDEALVENECMSLVHLDNSLESPSPLKIFDHFLVIGGWPPDIMAECSSLGHYLIALSQFGTGYGHVRECIEPSRLAAAALALAVKITNLSRAQTCQYDFFPPRLEHYTSYTFKEIHPVVRRISTLLRSKPVQADVLIDFFPTWAKHEWM